MTPQVGKRLFILLSMSFFIHLSDCGMMDKIKDRIKKEKKCVPEVVAIKKTRVVPVAVPIKIDSGSGYEEVMNMKDMPMSSPYPQSYAATSPSATTSYSEDEGGDDPYSSSGGNYEDSGDDGDSTSGYNDNESSDDDDHGESMAVPGNIIGEANSSDDEGYESESDDDYKRRSSNSSSPLLSLSSKKRHGKKEPSSSNSATLPIGSSLSKMKKKERIGGRGKERKSGHHYEDFRKELMSQRRNDHGSSDYELPPYGESHYGRGMKEGSRMDEEEVDFKGGSKGWEVMTKTQV